MFTETELREALEHSAARAATITDQVDPGRTRRRTPRLLPALAAAAVVGVVATVVVTVGGSSAVHRPAAGSDVAGTTTSATAHVPARIEVADLVNIGAASAGGVPWQYDLGSPLPGLLDDFESVVPEMTYPNGRPRTTLPAGSVELVVLPESLHFDPATRFFDAQQVDVDGDPGYYGDVVLRPISGGARAGADRALGIRKPDGTWIFVEALVKDPASVSVDELIATVRRLKLTTGEASSVRFPVTTGFLPAGMSLVQVGATQDSPNADAVFRSGSKQLEIILPEPIVGFPASIGRATATASKVVAGRSIQVKSVGYDQATVQRVLDTLQLHDFADATDWPDLQQAFG